VKYLPATLVSKPATLIDAQEWRKWRDSLVGDLTAAAVNRVIGAVSAALNLAAAHDSRLASHRAWHVGLQGLPNANRARNMILDNDQVRDLVDAAYAKGERFGLFVETLATTGARPSQASRIEVGDLRLDNPAEPKLAVPRSGKGGGRLRVQRKADRIPVPITVSLAARLKAAAAGRPHDAPLLLWRDDRGWGVDPSANYRADFRAIVAEVGLDPDEVSAYALRHSSICRQLMANVPVRVVAIAHDTSVTQIEAHYSKYISDHSDQLSRRALLQLDAPRGGNVFSIREAR
jgi:integrase